MELNELVDIVSKNDVVFVDFFADWCGPCQMLKPIVEKLEEEFKDVKFVKINVDESQELATHFSIMSIPHIILFVEGDKAFEHSGLASEEMLSSLLKAHSKKQEEVASTGRQIDTELCIGCGACISVCPCEALTLNDDGKCMCIADKCIDCMACVSACPVGAIK